MTFIFVSMGADANSMYLIGKAMPLADNPQDFRDYFGTLRTAPYDIGYNESQ